MMNGTMTDDLLPAAPPPETEAPDTLATAAREAGLRSAELKHQLDECNGDQKFLETIVSHRDKEWWLHLKELYEREVERLKRLRQSGNPSIGPIDELYRRANEQASQMPTRFPSNIEWHAKDQKIAINGNHPRYFFDKYKFLEAIIDDEKFRCTVQTREGKLGTLPADPNAILEKVRYQLDRLFSRKFDGHSFLARVRQAYLAAIKAQNNAREGDPIPLREIFSGITKKAKAYKIDEFIVDLSMLVEKGPAATAGYRFELQQTRDTQEGILLLGTAGTGMVNLMIFKNTTRTP